MSWNKVAGDEGDKVGKVDEAAAIRSIVPHV